eukprot:CAMPEP_0115111018 /NCGR_PEP_ID=MMETSP0227-20121206/39765_1 /TAXON_ID=89957 /ORGANISM="Polarella glacialis, Strain CCMP 1383" /LENGTH=155 /DNA_ID=CAMNT_0002510255 /DNA_START=206 /DNA_END=673 /DNA_ORIENTATION=-
MSPNGGRFGKICNDSDDNNKNNNNNNSDSKNNYRARHAYSKELRKKDLSCRSVLRFLCGILEWLHAGTAQRPYERLGQSCARIAQAFGLQCQEAGMSLRAPVTRVAVCPAAKTIAQHDLVTRVLGDGEGRGAVNRASPSRPPSADQLHVKVLASN